MFRTILIIISKKQIQIINSYLNIVHLQLYIILIYKNFINPLELQ